MSILAADQKALAERGAAVGTAKFLDDDIAPGEGEPLRSPRISDALFHVDCSVAQHHRVSDHELIVGFVHHGTSATREQPAGPLVFFDRGFWAMGERV